MYCLKHRWHYCQNRVEICHAPSGLFLFVRPIYSNSQSTLSYVRKNSSGLQSSFIKTWRVSFTLLSWKQVSLALEWEKPRKQWWRKTFLCVGKKTPLLGGSISIFLDMFCNERCISQLHYNAKEHEPERWCELLWKRVSNTPRAQMKEILSGMTQRAWWPVHALWYDSGLYSKWKGA